MFPTTFFKQTHEISHGFVLDKSYVLLGQILIKQY